LSRNWPTLGVKSREDGSIARAAGPENYSIHPPRGEM
jgi:hypothetical protein